ncbi:NERD domain-containing protein [Sphingomonas sp. LB-2]|uniref:NERD domain-containing protein n=1 Tax=Sphingomonas caeni TaxID=2984949 RepID=UPI00222F5258|nr:NERD domain-containing protein [Sphingomonas caeni]MCW3845981.1 NERD domain-containing protein [Sphingomonas caeni]
MKGLEALAQSLPINWLIYASLNAYPPNDKPIEIDVIAVMDDRIVLLELKDWNGVLTSNGDNWVLGKSRRGRSPVTVITEKARKLKTLISNQIPSLGRFWVDGRVILTGSATNEFLPDAEKPFVLSLSEARLLGNPAERNRILGKVQLTKVRPNMLVKDFERLFGNTKYFQPCKMTWDGYEVSEEDFYKHRHDVWREHRAHRARDERVKALLRLWRFDHLPTLLNEPDGRRTIAERESNVLAHLGEERSWMAERGILQEISAPAEEILTQHHQLVSIPNGWTTLRRYLGREGANVTGEQRVDIAHALASMTAELHAKGVAHRDIGGDCVWIGDPTNMKMTGFFSARLPGERSVWQFSDALATYAEPEPDWGVEPTAFERDVRSLGLLMRDLEAFDGGNGGLPPGWEDVVDKALAPPSERYPDARLLAEALGELKTPSGPEVDQSRLDGFETSAIPYVAYPSAGEVQTKGRASRYESGPKPKGLVVKIWNGVTRGDAKRDHALLAMLETAAELRALPARGVAPVVDCGLSQVGPFVVTRFVEGTTLETPADRSEGDLLALLAAVIDTVAELHQRDLSHGDLHPANVVVSDDGIVTLIDLLDVAPLGEGRLRSPGWAPADYERRSEKQIDRFAAAKMVLQFTAGRPEVSARNIADAARTELARPAIETLDPLAEAIDIERRRLLAPPPREFRLAARNLADQVLQGDDGHLWVKSYRSASGVESYFITGLNQRLLIRFKHGEIDHIELNDSRLQELAQGVPLRMTLSLTRGEPGGGQALVEFLRVAVPPLEADHQPTAPIVEDDDADDAWEDSQDLGTGAEPDLGANAALPQFPLDTIDVSRLWLRAAEIEEDSVLTVRLDTRLPDVGTAAMFRYATPRPLEFEDDDTVEVRLAPGAAGRRLGLLDLARSDDTQLAIRDMRNPIMGGGEMVALIDRRDRVSKERRRRAVERVTARKSVIPHLIDYFDSTQEAPETDYDLKAAEEDRLIVPIFRQASAA